MSNIQGTGGGSKPSAAEELLRAEQDRRLQEERRQLDAEALETPDRADRSERTQKSKETEPTPEIAPQMQPPLLQAPPRDEVEQVRDVTLLGGTRDPASLARAQAQLDSLYLPETRQIVEQAFGVRVDPLSTLKTLETVKNDPQFKQTVSAYADLAERFIQQAMRELAQEEHAAPPLPPEPKPEPPRDPLPPLEREARVADPKPEPPRDVLPPVDRETRADGLRPDSTRGSRPPPETEARVEKPKLEPPLAATPPNLTKEGVFPDYPAGEPGTIDADGQLIVDKEAYDDADADFAAAGMTPQFMHSYDTSYVELTRPVDLSTTRAVGAASPTEGVLFHTGAAPSGASSASEVFSQGDLPPMFHLLGNMANADMSALAYLFAGEAMRELGLDIRDAQRKMQMRQKLNQAMRKEYADFLAATTHLTKTNVKDPRKIEKVEWVYKEPMPIYDEKGNLLRVEMVPVAQDFTFQGTTIPPTGGKKETETKLSAAQVAEAYLPQAGKDEAAKNPPYGTQSDGSFVARTSHFYVSASTVDARRQTFRTKLKTMKQDMQKEMLRVKQFVGIRKRVMESMMKIVKNNAEAGAKIIARIKT